MNLTLFAIVLMLHSKNVLMYMRSAILSGSTHSPRNKIAADTTRSKLQVRVYSLKTDIN